MEATDLFMGMNTAPISAQNPCPTLLLVLLSVRRVHARCHPSTFPRTFACGMCAQIAHRLSADVDYIPIRHPIAGLDHGILQPERARLAVGQRRGLRKRSARGEKTGRTRSRSSLRGRSAPSVSVLPHRWRLITGILGQCTIRCRECAGIVFIAFSTRASGPLADR